MLGDGFSIAAGLVHHQHTRRRAGLDVDGVDAGSVGRNNQKVPDNASKAPAPARKPARHLVPRWDLLIGMGVLQADRRPDPSAISED